MAEGRASSCSSSEYFNMEWPEDLGLDDPIVNQTNFYCATIKKEPLDLHL